MKTLKGELAFTVAAIALTVAMAAMAGLEFVRQGARLGFERPGQLAQLVAFALVVGLMLYGGLVYQLARAGYYRRLSRRSQAEAEAPSGGAAKPCEKPLLVLVPSYREELKVLRQTLLSAALMDYPRRRVVALLDDPPTGTPAEMGALEAARRLVRGLDTQFAVCAAGFMRAHWDFLARARLGPLAPAAEAQGLARLYCQAADWIEAQAPAWVGQGAGGHADRFFETEVLRRLVAEHRGRAERLQRSALAPAEIEAEYQRLSRLFDVRIESFERKRYANLSHAPNKAMNLNAYMGLLGGGYREESGPEGLVLAACGRGAATFQVAAEDYLLTLDADSVVLPDYARKLMAVMERDERVAVAQTPYSAFPGAPGRLERIAGATTDLQYMVHQGSSLFQAAYWVGANALLRRKALAEIRQEAVERGHTVPVFIQDRTVIEDTGSTVDLVARGWRVHNHPERLAYSATPPDFGSLVVQRRRWANGGLIILPSLFRYLSGRDSGVRAGEGFIRLHYLLSPTLANFGLLLLIVVPFEAPAASLWLSLAAAPYALVSARDLKLTGYRWRDLVGVYALNLLLVPVNIAGVLDSVRQLVSGRKAPFARTPKIEGRTATPLLFLALEALGLSGLLACLTLDLAAHRWTHAAMSGVNFALLAFAFSRFIGWRNALTDLQLAWAETARPAPAMTPPLHAAPALALGFGMAPISLDWPLETLHGVEAWQARSFRLADAEAARAVAEG
ncbi:glycosyltransferase family 2 protein [Phenylobacterium sp.]|uniref:glycosyltransferase family 2 protein n=1 Tax=Phenylobacterium sp. TaxID=1871053 RepID=UPI0011F5C95F|nr:glycosyltransferase family 2 protein [Phenylobacterium sp.]THD60479.1 MAG: glycosyltransferase [Phenylobacterium sp.]